MDRFELGALALVLIGCGGTAVRLPEEQGPSGTAGTKDDVTGASGASGGSAMAPGVPSTPELGGASAGGASGGPSADDGGIDPEAEAGAGGSEQPSPEPVHTLISLPSKPRGFVYGLQYEPGTPNTVYSLQADFETSRGSWDGCTQVTLGQCWYYDCPPGSQPYRIIGASTLQNAGALSAAVNGSPSDPIHLNAQPDYFYETVGMAALWPFAGGTVKFVATGAAVPAFSLEVPTPPTVTLTSLNGAPAPTTNTDSDGEPVPVTLTRSDGVQLGWTSHGTGTASLTLFGFEQQRFAAVCEFDATANRGELPAVLLQELEPGSNYHFNFRGTSHAHGEVNGWELEGSLSAAGGPVSPFELNLVTLR